MLNRNPIRHCKRCGKSICEVCSDQKRQLSKDDPQRYRVCDLCEFEMDNEQLMRNLAEVEQTSLDKIEVLTSHILQLNENKEQLVENQHMASQNLEERLKEKYEVHNELQCKRNKYNREVTAQTNAKNALH